MLMIQYFLLADDHFHYYFNDQRGSAVFQHCRIKFGHIMHFKSNYIILFTGLIANIKTISTVTSREMSSGRLVIGYCVANNGSCSWWALKWLNRCSSVISELAYSGILLLSFCQLIFDLHYTTFIWEMLLSKATYDLSKHSSSWEVRVQDESLVGTFNGSTVYCVDGWHLRSQYPAAFSSSAVPNESLGND